MRLQQIPLKIDFFIYSTSILQNFFVCHCKDINTYKSFEIIQGQHLRFLMFEDKTTKRILDFLSDCKLLYTYTRLAMKLSNILELGST